MLNEDLRKTLDFLAKNDEFFMRFSKKKEFAKFINMLENSNSNMAVKYILGAIPAYANYIKNDETGAKEFSTLRSQMMKNCCGVLNVGVNYLAQLMNAEEDEEQHPNEKRDDFKDPITEKPDEYESSYMEDDFSDKSENEPEAQTDETDIDDDISKEEKEPAIEKRTEETISTAEHKETSEILSNSEEQNTEVNKTTTDGLEKSNIDEPNNEIDDKSDENESLNETDDDYNYDEEMENSFSSDDFDEYEEVNDEADSNVSEEPIQEEPKQEKIIETEQEKNIDFNEEEKKLEEKPNEEEELVPIEEFQAVTNSKIIKPDDSFDSDALLIDENLKVENYNIEEKEPALSGDEVKDVKNQLKDLYEKYFYVSDRLKVVEKKIPREGGIDASRRFKVYENRIDFFKNGRLYKTVNNTFYNFGVNCPFNTTFEGYVSYEGDGWVIGLNPDSYHFSDRTIRYEYSSNPELLQRVLLEFCKRI